MRRHVTSRANAPPEAMGAPATVAPRKPAARAAAPALVPAPGLNRNDVDVTSSGLRRRSFGYARRVRLTLDVGTRSPMSEIPGSERAVISFHPIRPG